MFFMHTQESNEVNSINNKLSEEKYFYIKKLKAEMSLLIRVLRLGESLFPS